MSDITNSSNKNNTAETQINAIDLHGLIISWGVSCELSRQ